MSSYSRSQLSDDALLHRLKTSIAHDRSNTAVLLADIAEVDARRLYLPAGYPSMHAYCVEELGLCEQAAFKRIRAARTARAFPAVFAAVADGRLNLSGIILLTPHLNEATADELLTAVMHKKKSEIEQLLAERFPSSEVLPMIHALPDPNGHQLSPGTVGTDSQVVPGPVERSAPGRIKECDFPSRVAPIAAQRFALQVALSQSAHENLRYAQSLLSHQIPNGDLAGVLERVLEIAVRQLDKRKLGANSNQKSSTKPSADSRHIPAQVKHSVWRRDGGQCTFVSESGHRCTARKPLEFDHVVPLAHGGPATVGNLRLRCRAHNQYEADRVFGVEFMRGKRGEARQVVAREKASEVIPWLRALGFRAEEARWRAERCESIPDASLEERVRLALSYVSPRIASHRPAPA